LILLTNGGGTHESERAEKLSHELDVEITESMIVQSHSPFEEIQNLKDKNVLVLGGIGDSCRRVAERYGFKKVITAADLITAYPSIWPFANIFADYYKNECQPRPLPVPINSEDPTSSLKIDAVFVYNDPRDWGLDVTLIMDCLLSQRGHLGTLSKLNGQADLPNRGYQQDGQPPIYFSNPDLWFAAEFALNRLGQGGFREALEGVWRESTGGAELKKTIIGKPYQATYEYAEKKLNKLRQKNFGVTEKDSLRRVYMVGDNPASDIAGAIAYKSPFGSRWHSALLRTGVYQGEKLDVTNTPTTIVHDVYDAVKWACKHSKWDEI